MLNIWQYSYICMCTCIITVLRAQGKSRDFQFWSLSDHHGRSFYESGHWLYWDCWDKVRMSLLSYTCSFLAMRVFCFPESGLLPVLLLTLSLQYWPLVYSKNLLSPQVAYVYILACTWHTVHMYHMSKISLFYTMHTMCVHMYSVYTLRCMQSIHTFKLVHDS